MTIKIKTFAEMKLEMRSSSSTTMGWWKPAGTQRRRTTAAERNGLRGPGSCANEIVNSYLQRVYNEVTHVARENFWRIARVRAKFRTNWLRALEEGIPTLPLAVSTANFKTRVVREWVERSKKKKKNEKAGWVKRSYVWARRRKVGVQLLWVNRDVCIYALLLWNVECCNFVPTSIRYWRVLFWTNEIDVNFA